MISESLVCSRLSTNIKQANLLLDRSKRDLLVLLDDSAPSKEIVYQMVGDKLREKRGKSYRYLTTTNQINSIEYSYTSDLVNYTIKWKDGLECTHNIYMRNA